MQRNLFDDDDAPRDAPTERGTARRRVRGAAAPAREPRGGGGGGGGDRPAPGGPGADTQAPLFGPEAARRARGDAAPSARGSMDEASGGATRARTVREPTGRARPGAATAAPDGTMPAPEPARGRAAAGAGATERDPDRATARRTGDASTVPPTEDTPPTTGPTDAPAREWPAARPTARRPPGGALLRVTTLRDEAAHALRVPARPELDACRRCDLWRDATHGVPGEGPHTATLMLVGEQPGDSEDRAGRPFVGPAGRLLDELMAQAGIDRTKVFTTNAVKHFKWEPRGGRRIHKTPAQKEVEACAAWLERELAAVSPRAVLALGATAARALLGPGTTIEAARREGPARVGDTWVVVTFHPSALLRVPDPAVRARMTDAVRSDLAKAAELAGRG